MHSNRLRAAYRWSASTIARRRCRAFSKQGSCNGLRSVRGLCADAHASVVRMTVNQIKDNHE